MDDHLRIIERNLALAEHAARVDATAWLSTQGPRRSLRSRLATALVTLAARLDPAGVLPRREGVQACTANPA